MFAPADSVPEPDAVTELEGGAASVLRETRLRGLAPRASFAQRALLPLPVWRSG